MNLRRRRSFVCRNGRVTAGQTRAHVELWPQFGLTLSENNLDYQQAFGRMAPCYLEIGFGSGQSLLALAKAEPDKNFIGVETHKPGIGALFLGMQLNEIKNIRVFNHDCVDVLDKCIPDNSLDGVQIFFPDPWQKRRHHPRRLIQTEFVQKIITKLKPNGTLHLATDWDDYAVHMMKVVAQIPALTNLAGAGNFSTRSPYRPIETKFERRALREGRKIWELQFKK